jgi:small-conductance mechanosensitive channel
VTSFSLTLAYCSLVGVIGVVIRGMTPNRLVQRKLRAPIILAILAGLTMAVTRVVPLNAETAPQVAGLLHLAIALATIITLVVVVVNPLREDRVSTRFPNIVQDMLIAGLVVLVGTVLLNEKFLTTSAVGAVVVGFALQDTLGNAFAGLAIQIEKPFHVGQWIRIGEHEGHVEEITWRATKIRTKESTFVILPNTLMSKEPIVNFSEPIVPTRIWIEVGATYDQPPHVVKEAIFEAIANAPLALKDPEPDVLLMDFGASAITYRARFWLMDFARDLVARDQVRTNIYYTFKRRNIEIPWPIQIEYSREWPDARPTRVDEELAEVLRHVGVFATLSDDERRELATMGEPTLFAKDEAIVRQGEAGDSMFVVCAGRAAVTLEPNRQVVNEVAAGGYFGEMSLLTGDTRTATVVALTACSLMEIRAEAFRRFVMDKPGVLAGIAAEVERRRLELDRAQSVAVSGASTTVADRTFFDRVRAFLRLPA